MSALPETSKAVYLPDIGKQLELKTVKTPRAHSGSVVAKVLVTGINGLKLFAGYGGPFRPNSESVVGSYAIARVAEVSGDSTSLQVGQLVFVEGFIKSRDDPNTDIILGLFRGVAPDARKLSSFWKDGTWAEYVEVPLENCHQLDESRLLGAPSSGGLGYTTSELLYMRYLVIPYAGLKNIDLIPGQTVVIAPATGKFSSSSVAVASAMGARVIAMGRSLEKLEKLKSFPRVEIVEFSDHETNISNLKKLGTIDAVLDLSPFSMPDVDYLRSIIASLKTGGKVSLMGGCMKDFSIPYYGTLQSNITIKFQYMYTRDDVSSFIKLVESGLLKLGSSICEPVNEFTVDNLTNALASAEQTEGAIGQDTALKF